MGDRERNLLPAEHHFKGEAALQRRTWLVSMKDKNQARPWHVHAVWGSEQEKQMLPPSLTPPQPLPKGDPCAQEGLTNVIVTACRVRANDESNSLLKRLAEFLSRVFSPTKSVTTFDVPLLCCAAPLAFCLLIPLSRCRIRKKQKKKSQAMTKASSSIPAISRGTKLRGCCAEAEPRKMAEQRPDSLFEELLCCRMCHK